MHQSTPINTAPVPTSSPRPKTPSTTPTLLKSYPHIFSTTTAFPTLLSHLPPAPTILILTRTLTLPPPPPFPPKAPNPLFTITAIATLRNTPSPLPTLPPIPQTIMNMAVFTTTQNNNFKLDMILDMLAVIMSMTVYDGWVFEGFWESDKGSRWWEMERARVSDEMKTWMVGWMLRWGKWTRGETGC